MESHENEILDLPHGEIVDMNLRKEEKKVNQSVQKQKCHSIVYALLFLITTLVTGFLYYEKDHKA